MTSPFTSTPIPIVEACVQCAPNMLRLHDQLAEARERIDQLQPLAPLGELPMDPQLVANVVARLRAAGRIQGAPNVEIYGVELGAVLNVLVGASPPLSVEIGPRQQVSTATMDAWEKGPVDAQVQTHRLR